MIRARPIDQTDARSAMREAYLRGLIARVATHRAGQVVLPTGVVDADRDGDLAKLLRAVARERQAGGRR